MRRRLAMIANANAPYRQALHLRIARELPELRVMSVFTHDTWQSQWNLAVPAEIGPVFFGKGEAAEDASRRPVREWRKAGDICALLEREHVTDVVLHGYNDAGRLRIMHFCRRRGIRCFLWGDSNKRSDRARGFRRIAKRGYLRRVLFEVDAVMCCGSLGRAFFESYGANPERVFYVPCEPDYAVIEAVSAAAVSAVRKRFLLDPRRRHLVYSGRLAREKRVDLLVEAFGLFADEHPNWDWVVIGDGPLRDEIERSVPVRHRERVRFVGFQSDQSVVAAIYRACDLLCLPSERDAWALVVNEAAAAGLAIITSDVVGASAELVRNNGMTFASCDAADLLRVLRACARPDEIDGLKAKSADVIAEWRRVADPIDGLRLALKSRPGRATHA